LKVLMWTVIVPVKAVKVLVEAERVPTEGVKEILILLVQAVKM
jgi:hypothetical protein